MGLNSFKRALWVYHLNTGSCNGCDIEILAALTPRYDVERFGIVLVGSPRHADVLLVTGPVTMSTSASRGFQVKKILYCSASNLGENTAFTISISQPLHPPVYTSIA